MKKLFLLSLAVLAVTASPALYAVPQTFNGVVSDTMCGKKHMMPGMSDAKCVQACVKEGSSYALVVGDKVYTLAGKPDSIAPFAGKHVRVQGEASGSSIKVASIQAQ